MLTRVQKKSMMSNILILINMLRVTRGLEKNHNSSSVLSVRWSSLNQSSAVVAPLSSAQNVSTHGKEAMIIVQRNAAETIVYPTSLFIDMWWMIYLWWNSDAEIIIVSKITHTRMHYNILRNVTSSWSHVFKAVDWDSLEMIWTIIVIYSAKISRKIAKCAMRFTFPNKINKWIKLTIAWKISKNCWEKSERRIKS